MTSEEARAAQIQRDLDEIREALANGTEEPGATEDILLHKVTNPEKEVRKAALEALMQLNDTNAIPRLQQRSKALKTCMTNRPCWTRLPIFSFPNHHERASCGAIVSQPRPPRSPRPPKTKDSGSPKTLALRAKSWQRGQPPGGPRPTVPTPKIQRSPNRWPRSGQSGSTSTDNTGSG